MSPSFHVTCKQPENMTGREFTPCPIFTSFIILLAPPVATWLVMPVSHSVHHLYAQPPCVLLGSDSVGVFLPLCWPVGQVWSILHCLCWWQDFSFMDQVWVFVLDDKTLTLVKGPGLSLCARWQDLSFRDQVWVFVLGDKTSLRDKICVFVLGDKTLALGTRSLSLC